MRTRKRIGWIVTALAVAALPWLGHAEPLSVLRFDQYLDSLRQQAGIPGLSAGIIQDGALVWERGFGQADVERNVPATPDTPYPIAGLTSALSATLALECVERGVLQLDAPVVEFFPTFAEPTSTLRDVMQHVLPGGKFAYDLDRYDAVAAALKTCSGTTLRTTVADGLLGRFAMVRSVPGHDFQTWSPPTLAQFTPETVERYRAVMSEMARAYRTSGRKATPVPFAPLTGLTGGSGLVSTVRDLARFQIALEQGEFLRPETRLAAWTIQAERPAPHGLGWFVQIHDGVLVVWQFGVINDAYSSLMITVPSRGATLILLANSDGLVAPFGLSTGDILVSPFARLFLRLFA